MLFSLQYLRGIASLLVVFYHARSELNGVYAQSDLGDLLFSNGYIGVDLFFMISGFVIMLSTERDKSPFSFIIKRLFRVYPAYFVCLIFAMLVFNKSFDIEFFKAMAFVNLDISSSPPFFGYSIILTAWTLMYEIIFYILFAISMSISWRHRLPICSIIILLIVTSLNYFYNDGVKIDGYAAIPLPSHSQNIMLFARVLSSPMFYEFIIGMIIYWLYSHIKPGMILTKISKPLLLSSVMAFIFFFLSGYNGGHGLLNCGLFAAILLFSCVIYERCYPVKISPPLNMLGDISYSLYLIHPLVISLLAYGIITTVAYTQHKGFSSLFLIFAMSIPPSIAMFYFVEKKFVLLARDILSKSNSQTANNTTRFTI
ncbi:acyltransferase [Citrobacter portucalensis]|uniref:acyltransferase family protein n=1 Tax=Citrobacter portucalensis TaxID=1639133 RepID=UPI0010A476E0|nr:acyltransferase [Citrobacter portucalensis]QCD02203.1 acyltransferase [Citrobacter portucalensis]